MTVLDDVVVELAVVEVEGVAKAGAAAGLDGYTQGVLLALVLLGGRGDLAGEQVA